MDSNLLNISKIETFFNGLFYKKLTSNLFFTSLPSTIKSSWSEMVLVDANITDNNVGEGFVNVFLYAKPLGDSKKNVAKLSQMEKTLNGLVESSRDEHYHIAKFKTYSDYDEARKFHFNVVSLTLQIV